MAKEHEGSTGPVEPEYASQEETKAADQIGLLLPPKTLRILVLFIGKCLNCDRDTLFAMVEIPPNDPLSHKQTFYFCSLCGQYTEIK